MSWDGTSAKHGEKKKYIHENILTNWRRRMRAERHQLLRLWRPRAQTGKNVVTHGQKKNKMASFRPWKFGLKQRKKNRNYWWKIFICSNALCIFAYWLRARIPTGRVVLPFPCKRQSNSSGLTSSFFAFAEYFFLCQLRTVSGTAGGCLSQTHWQSKKKIIIIKSLKVAVGSAWIWIDLQIYLWNISWPLCLKKKKPKEWMGSVEVDVKIVKFQQCWIIWMADNY